RAGQFINIVPVSGVFFGTLFLGEQLTLSLLIGGVFILAGLWMTNRA
ncbi:MAG: EamA family transporter, partial [Gammaproteobacteria bacterium]|nr:EamA family transporter [Gammaproteobacteria bacterium]